MLVLFLRRLVTNEVLVRSNAMLVLFLWSLVANEVLLSSNAMGERDKIAMTVYRQYPDTFI